MPGPDDETPPPWLSPVAAVTHYIAHIEAVRGTITEAVRSKQFDGIAQAFVAGDRGGNPALRTAIQEIGAAVVGAAAYAALGSGGAGMPNPECGGSSLETIPPTLTPVVHYGLAVHKVSELPRLRKQLAEASAFLDRVAAAQSPKGAERGKVRTSLEEVVRDLT